MAFKVKINELPSLNKEPQITTTIKENPYKANVEIEKDELVVRPDLAAIYKAKGEKHSNGGIKTYLPDNSFVISDDKSLSLTKDEQEMLELKKGGPKSPSKNTPADVLKRNLDVKHYNKMTSILTNPKKDEFSKRTAAMMLSKYEDVLGRVAFAQEAKKGFPTGLPEFSQDAAPVIADSLKENIEQQPQFMKKGGYTNPYKMTTGGVPGFTNYYDKSAKKQYTSPQGLDPEVFYKPEVLEYLKGLDKMKGFDNDKGVYKDYTWGERHQQAFEHFGEDYFFPRRKSTEMGQTVTTPRNTKISMPTINSGAMPTKIDGKPVNKRELQDWQFSDLQMANLAASALDVASVRRDFPYRSQIKSPLVELEKNNPQRMMNNIDNSVYGALQANRGLNPYMAAGNNASIFGRGLDVKNSVDTGNVAIANMQNQMNNQSQKADAMANIGFDQQYYRESVNGRANFDNMKQTARNRLREETNKYAQDNQTLQYNMMTLNNPAYGYDYKSGQFYLTGKDPMSVQTSQTGMDTQLQNLIINKLQTGTLTPAEATFYGRIFSGRKMKMGGKINPYKKIREVNFE